MIERPHKPASAGLNQGCARSSSASAPSEFTPLGVRRQLPSGLPAQVPEPLHGASTSPTSHGAQSASWPISSAIKRRVVTVARPNEPGGQAPARAIGVKAMISASGAAHGERTYRRRRRIIDDTKAICGATTRAINCCLHLHLVRPRQSGVVVRVSGAAATPGLRRGSAPSTLRPTLGLIRAGH